MSESVNDRKQQMLSPVDKFNGAILVQGSAHPVLRDNWPAGIDFICGHCNRMVLVVGAADDQLWDIGFECFACKRLSVSPSLPPGMALPFSYVLTPEGRYRIDQTVDMRRVVIVGETAKARRLTEAGHKGATFGQKTEFAQDELDAALLRLWMRQLREILGARYDKLYLSDMLARNSPTPPKHRHGLMVIVESLEYALASFETGAPEVNVRRITEIHVLLTILDRWKHHMLWPKMVEALDGEYEHTIITLAAATFLEDAGNGVVFHENPSGRIPDLLLVVGSQQRVAVEIKAPSVLRDRHSELTIDDAKKIIRSAAKKAGTGRKGQLANTRSAMLVIGGFHLYQSDLDSLEHAARAYLDSAARADLHSHFIAIAILSLGSALELPSAHQDAQRRISGTLSVRIAENFGYNGGLTLCQEPVVPLNRLA